MRKAVLLTLLVILMPLPTALELEEVGTSMAGECCQSQTADLFLTGPDGLTLFDSELDTLQKKSLSSSIPGEESIGKWSFQPAFHGEIPADTWTFNIHYEVENAGGIQLNATVKISIGPNQYTGQTPAGDTYVPGGTGILSTDVEVEAGTLVSSDTITVELIMGSMVFVVPGAGAKVDFLWGDADHSSDLDSNLPLMDIDLEEPVVDGRTLHIPAILRSGFGQRLLEEGTISCKVDGEVISEDPVKTPSGLDVKATWSWSAPESFEGGTVNVEVSYLLNPSSDEWTAESTFEVELEEGEGSTTYYSAEEPLRTLHSSMLEIRLDADLSSGDSLTLNRNVQLTVSDDMAYWLRWGMTNQRAAGLSHDSVWNSQYLSDGFTEEQWTDKRIDGAEKEALTSSLQSAMLVQRFLPEALQLEGEGLLGGGFSEFHTIQVKVDLNDDDSVSRTPVTLMISTTQSVDEGSHFDLLQQFILPQSDVFWSRVHLSVSLQSDSKAAFIDIHDKVSGELVIDHMRRLTHESISFNIDDVLDWNRLDIRVKPSMNPLHSPLPLAFICAGLMVFMFISCMLLGRGKTRLPLYLESLLVPLVGAAYWYAFPIESMGALMGLVGGVWMVTTVITPRRDGGGSMQGIDAMDEVPTITCPKCTTINPVVSDVRPLRLPCGGCGRILKIVG